MSYLHIFWLLSNSGDTHLSHFFKTFVYMQMVTDRFLVNLNFVLLSLRSFMWIFLNGEPKFPCIDYRYTSTTLTNLNSFLRNSLNHYRCDNSLATYSLNVSIISREVAPILSHFKCWLAKLLEYCALTFSLQVIAASVKNKSVLSFYTFGQVCICIIR